MSPPDLSSVSGGVFGTKNNIPLEPKKDEKDNFNRLSQYMMEHNYGINDYEEYSRDPEWKKLHKAVFPDYHQIAEEEFESKEKIVWLMSVVRGTDEAEAKRIVQALENYSGTGYQSIHWDKKAELQQTRDILRVFDSVKAYPYRGVVYRGLSFKTKKELMKALSRGRGKWEEPGITSFSTDKKRAREFAMQGEWGLVLTCKNNKNGIPFKHISTAAWEEEILSPGGLRNNGWNLDMDSLYVDKENKIVYVEMKEI